MYAKTNTPSKRELIRRETQAELGLPKSEQKFRAALQQNCLSDCYDALQHAYNVRCNQDFSCDLMRTLIERLSSINLSPVHLTMFKRAEIEYQKEQNKEKFLLALDRLIITIERLIDDNLPPDAVKHYYRNKGSNNGDSIENKIESISDNNGDDMPEQGYEGSSSRCIIF